VNRPDFGTPLSRTCFEGNSPGLAEVVQFIASAGLARWLGQVIEVLELNATAEEATLLVDLTYRVRGEDEVHREQRRVPLAPGGLS
jgi:phage baseplate assembly protein W